MQAARISALSTFARENGVRLISANETLADGAVHQQVIAASTASASRSRIIRSEFRPSTSGPGQMCVAVEISSD